MERSTKVMITLFVLVFFVLSLYFFTDWFSKVTGYLSGKGEREQFAACLSDKGAYYYSSNCIECIRQSELLGEDIIDLVRKVECGEDRCLGLRELPAWEIDGRFYYGKKNFSELTALSGCEIES